MSSQPPGQPPIGLALSRTARIVGRAFEEALAAAGGSLSTWLVLMNLATTRLANQRALADAVGLREATLTHHLNALEAEGLLRRHRDPDNRRVQIVELTDTGRARFAQLREVARAFDQRLRAGLDSTELERVQLTLQHLVANAASSGHNRPAVNPT